VFPQYIAPAFAGISIFCLTHQNSLLVTNLFGGAMANEGLGFLSVSLDWTTVSSGGNPLYLPIRTLFNSLAGYLLSIGIFMGLYYSNHWNAKSFPFLSPQMFSDNSTSHKFVSYNQSAILDSRYRVDQDQLAVHGLPHYTSSHVFAMTVRNLGITASISHMILWHWDDIKSAFSFLSVKSGMSFKKINWKIWQHRGHQLTREEADKICPHYGVMQAYSEVPSSWFAAVWVIAALVGFITSTIAKSTLPWWAFLIAFLISAFCLPFFAALNAMFGFHVKVESLVQVIGAYMLPGLPIANMCKYTHQSSMTATKNL
jgi:hypothetical protein